ncbi:AMP-binding protein [Tropicimonas marinistellae]|uniref:AMP-binding protein n=1 Tax=Tropicimonas marinistellae TaxID=1739787 RepID=UPI0008297F28|nr:AMP-binding protein [Tropicimonas marinistellae]
MTSIFDLFDAEPHFGTDRLALSMRMGLREERWSYAEYRTGVNSIAEFLLKERGLSPGDRVLLRVPNSPRAALALHGIMRAGLVAVPIDTGSTAGFVDEVARLTDARLWIGGGPGTDRQDGATIALAELPTEGAGAPSGRPKADDLAEIVFTSGTTGAPKGVMLTHRNLAANVQAILSVVPSDEPLRLLSVLPLSHMFEQTVGLGMPLLLGGSVYYAAARNSVVIRRALKRHKITTMLLVPQMLELMMVGIEREARARGGWPGWDASVQFAGRLPLPVRRLIFRRVIGELGGHFSFFMCGGAHLPPELHKAWEAVGIRILQGYGATECSPVIASNTLLDRNPGSVGRALPGVDLRCDDAGEIQVRGGSVFKGYWQNTDATRDAFTEDGWFRTGDLAEVDGSGRITLRGRQKDMIALPTGMNVFPEDVEEALTAAGGSGDVGEVAVVGAADAQGNLHVHAVFCTELDDAALEIAVRKANSELADHQRITGYSRWHGNSLPRTALRKLKRKAIEEALATGAADDGTDAADRSADPLLHAVAAICKVPAASIRDDSDLRLDLGFDSLKLVELAGVIELEMGAAIDEGQLSEINKYSDLADAVGMPASAGQMPYPPVWPRSHFAGKIRRRFQAALVFPALRLAATRFTVAGLEVFETIEGPCLFIGNHNSHVDTLSILRALPGPRRTRTAVAAAADYFFGNKIAAMAGALALNLFPFSRGGNIRQSLEYCGDLVDENWSILVYPEGTRSPTGELLPFKPGVAFLATGLKVPIVPICVLGGFQILPKGQSFPKRHPVSVTFGAPIRVDADAPIETVTRMLEDRVRELVADCRAGSATYSERR